MEFPPAGKLLFHLAKRLEGNKEGWRMGTKEGGMCVPGCTVPSKWQNQEPSSVLINSVTVHPPQPRSLGVRKVDEQGMKKVNVSRNIYKQNLFDSVRGAKTYINDFTEFPKNLISYHLIFLS